MTGGRTNENTPHDPRDPHARKLAAAQIPAARGAGMILLDLPYPPSLWNLYQGFGKRRHKTTEYKLWLWEAGLEILRTPWPHRQSIKGKFALVVLAGRFDKVNRDLDNLLKAPCDLLQTQGLIENDHHAASITIAWSPRVKGRRIQVSVWPFDAERAAIAALPPEGARGQGEAA